MSPATEAQYRSRCMICGGWIEEGDMIKLYEETDWVHEECWEMENPE